MIINKAKSTDSVGASVQQGKGVSTLLKVAVFLLLNAMTKTAT
jgi:hypothetical protein